MQTFIYKIQTGSKDIDDSMLLYDAGKEGWDLVSVIFPVKTKYTDGNVALYYFKKEVDASYFRIGVEE